jgi:tetratricopeptide (TPR) repeat protein
MQLLQKIEFLFEELKKGHYTVQDEFFETIWVNFTRLSNNQEAKLLLNKINLWAEDVASVHPDLLNWITLCRGFIEFLSDNYDVAINYLHKAYELFKEKNDEDGLAACGICIGYLHRSTGEIDLALKYGLPGLNQLSRSGKNKMFQIIGSYWIGGVYADTGHLDEALLTFQQGLQVDYPPGIKSMGARLTNGIAGVYMKQKKYSLALENFQKTLDLCDASTEKTFRSRGLTDLGDYYYQMGDYPMAIQYNQEALVIRREMNLQNPSITNLMNLGSIYYKQGKFNEAIQELSRALKLAEEIKVKVKMYQIHQLLSDIYLGTGNMQESLAHYKAFHEIREDVNHDDLDRKVKNQVKLFQAELTQKENAVIKAQKLEIEKKNIQLQETIDELTLAKISKKARALTLSIGIILFIFQDRILENILHVFASDNYWLALFIKVTIIFSLEPVNKAIEHYLLKKVIKKKKVMIPG